MSDKSNQDSAETVMPVDWVQVIIDVFSHHVRREVAAGKDITVFRIPSEHEGRIRRDERGRRSS